MDNPIPHVEDVYFYSRENNILIANKTNGEKVPLVKFKQKFIDFAVLSDTAFQYLKNYMQYYPESFYNLTHLFANRRVRDPYARWCERRTPSVSGGAVYSIISRF